MNLLSEKEQGIIDYPQLMPHLNYNIIDNLGVVVNDFANQHVLYGKLYVDIIKEIDGKKSVLDIAQKVKSSSLISIKTALVKLRSLGLIASAEHDLSKIESGYWTAMGATPRYAQDNTMKKKIYITNIDKKLSSAKAMLTQQVKECGLKTTAQYDKCDMMILIVDNYLNDNIPGFLAKHTAKPYILVSVDFTQILFGPVFNNASDKFCFECLRTRLEANAEVYSFIKNHQGKKQVQAMQSFHHPMMRGVFGLLINELVRYYIYDNYSYIYENIVSLDIYKMEMKNNFVGKRPQCKLCGDPMKYEIQRVNTPFELVHQTERVFTSGGMRAISPQETYNKFSHLISPISGVVKELIKSPLQNQNDPWFHCYVAGQNLAMNTDNILRVKSSLRSLSSGKGRSDAQARVSCIMESIERYSSVYTGFEVSIRKPMTELNQGEYIDPRTFLLYSDSQYENRQEINAQGKRFSNIPMPFNPQSPIDWTPVWSLTHKKFKYFPTSLLYFSYNSQDKNEISFGGGDSNGLASGTTKEDALLQGFYELIERDAFAIWWYNRLPARPVDFESFNDNFLNQARAYYAKFNRNIWMLDITSDFGIPVFVACSMRTDGRKDLIFAPGAHENPLIAALRAVCELNQYLSAVRDVGITSETILIDDKEMLEWWDFADCENQYHFKPQGAMKTMQDYQYTPRASDADDVLNLQSLMQAKGLEVLAFNTMRPDINVPVVRAIVPGLRHFWARFAKGRLYDVPVAMGKLPKALNESELNPIPVFI